MEDHDVSKDLSGWTKRLMDFLEQSRLLGIGVRVTLEVDGGDGPVVVGRYVAPPLEPSSDTAPAFLDRRRDNASL